VLPWHCTTILLSQTLWPPSPHKSSIHVCIEERYEQKIPYFDFKPWLMKLFFMISCGLQRRATNNSAYIFFFSLSKGLDNAQSFHGYILLTKVFSHLILLFNITCAGAHFIIRGTMMNRRHLYLCEHLHQGCQLNAKRAIHESIPRASVTYIKGGLL